MDPLIEIKTIPIEIQVKTTSASLEYTRGTAEMEISRSDDGGLDIKSRPIRLKLDSFEQRNLGNAGASRTSTSTQQGTSKAPQKTTQRSTQPSFQASYQATAAYARQGRLLLSASVTPSASVLQASDQSLIASFNSIPTENMIIPTENMLPSLNVATENTIPTENMYDHVTTSFTPQESAFSDWQVGDMQIAYSMNKINFDWKIENASFKFTPGDVEISVTQHPDVTIKYMGGPIYVPPSSDPDYTPVDVKA